MKATGETTKPMVKVDSSMLMEMFMMATGEMIRPMEEELTVIWMELNTRESGKMINNMVKVQRHGQMVQATMEHTLKAANMAQELSLGPIRALTMVTLLRITLMAEVNFVLIVVYIHFLITERF